MGSTAKKSTSNPTKPSPNVPSAATTRNQAKNNQINNQIKSRLRNGDNRPQPPPLPKRSSNSCSIYDVNGKLRGTQEDICDCFEKKCPGCHFPCEKCKSEKCGPTCRVYRRYCYEEIEFDGKTEFKKNPKSL